MTYIKRFIEKDLSNWFKQTRPPYHCVLLSGARQCGKSTLLKHFFPTGLHINLALEGGFTDAIDATAHFDDFTLLVENRFDFKTGSGRVLIIDEAQLSKKLGGYVRFFKEKWQTQQVILTGSTLSTLFDGHENPTGRVVEFTLRPFNFQEFLAATGREALLHKLKAWRLEKPLSETAHRETLTSLRDYLIVGGLPEVALTFKEGTDYQRLLGNIFALYKRDFNAQFSESDTAIFHQCFQRIAAATGSPIKNSSIIKSSSPGYTKVPRVLQTMEAWHLVLKVACETSELSRTATMVPKRYLFDHGIRYLQNPSRFAQINLQETDDPRREEWGGLIENFVLTELVSLGSVLPIKSWSKTNQSGNVDFIYSHGQQTAAIEVKLTPRFNRKHLAGLLAYHDFYKKTPLCLANLDRGGIYKEGRVPIMNVPIYALFGYLGEAS